MCDVAFGDAPTEKGRERCAIATNRRRHEVAFAKVVLPLLDCTGVHLDDVQLAEPRWQHRFSLAQARELPLGGQQVVVSVERRLAHVPLALLQPLGQQGLDRDLASAWVVSVLVKR